MRVIDSRRDRISSRPDRMEASFGEHLERLEAASGERLDRPDQKLDSILGKTALTEITLEFVLGRVERVLEEIAELRDDMRVTAAICERVDGTLQRLINEVRAEHSRFDRLDRRVRELEEESSK
jgi:chromosome segregation ATPase